MHMALLQALSILLLASMLVPGPGSAEEAPSGTELIHDDANGGLTIEAMLSATDGTNSPASSGTYSVAAVRRHKKYLMELYIGTPPEPFWAVADTGSDLVWTKQPKLCASSTFTHKKCPDGMCDTCCDGLCMFKKKYSDDRKAARGFIGNEKLTFLTGKTTDISKFRKKKTTDVSFGWAIDNDDFLPSGADGIVGLNRGPRSLVEQLKVTKFSYCLSNKLEPKLSSHFRFGDNPDFPGGNGGESGYSLQNTRLVKIGPTEKTTSVTANRYYVELDGICLINHPCPPFQKDDLKLKSTEGKGVMFVDSGTRYTSLESTVFGVLKNLLAQELGLGVESFFRDGKKTCFQPDADRPPSEPKMELVLQFPGAKMHLPWANYTNKKTDEAGKFCLTIRESDHSLLGNFHQQNIHMLYDLTTEGKENLSFLQEVDCSKLPS